MVRAFPLRPFVLQRMTTDCAGRASGGTVVTWQRSWWESRDASRTRR